MTYIRAFIAGLIVPSVLSPFILGFLVLTGHPQALDVFFFHTIPLIWGLWNVLYFACFIDCFPKNVRARMLLTGGFLGVLLSLIGIYGLHIPIYLGMNETEQHLPLFFAPVVYAILWSICVDRVNRLLNLRS